MSAAQEQRESEQAKRKAAELAWRATVIERSKLRVPICGAPGATVDRAVWDEAWLAYSKAHRPEEYQYYRILNEGFYAEELDDLRPGWRPVEARIKELEARVAQMACMEMGEGDPK